MITEELAFTLKHEWFTARQRSVPSADSTTRTALADELESNVRVYAYNPPVVGHVTFISRTPATDNVQHMSLARACHVHQAICLLLPLSHVTVGLSAILVQKFNSTDANIRAFQSASGVCVKSRVLGMGGRHSIDVVAGIALSTTLDGVA
jgi:hypothetical protein